ncbi:hypothetical protein Q1695_014647 [Nippostrongylus brasiliensis]|nr:hypothetical protein Q1695_014647 [Nippostrongylus brasiliensis]
MATGRHQLVRRNGNTSERELSKQWAGTFPEEITSRSQSNTFVCRMMYISFCHIISSRMLLPKNCFRRRTIDGSLRAYVMDSNEILGGRLIQKFKGITKAVEHQYLRELILVVSAKEEEENDAIEVFIWRVRYDVDGDPQVELRQPDGTVMTALRFKGMAHLKKQVAEILNMIRILCRETLAPLPAGASATLRITYTDRTPKGYQAEGFYRSPEDHVLRPDAQEVEITNSLQTNYHGSALVVQSVFIDDAYAVGMRLKEDARFPTLNDSLNESIDDHAAGDDGNRSNTSKNDTMERISEGTPRQTATVEIPRNVSSPPMGENVVSHSSPTTTELDASKMTRLRGRGSPAQMVSSESTSPEEIPAKRARRGRAKTTAHALQERNKSPVVVGASPPLPIRSTPLRAQDGDLMSDTPPATRTPGIMKVAKVTPKEAPRRRVR